MEPASEIFTSRLRLRKTKSEDAVAVFEYQSDPEVTRYLTFSTSTEVADAVRFLNRCEQVWSERTAFPWAITRQDHDHLLGVVEARPTAHGIELGFVLRRSAWGNGYMTEAVEAVSDWALGQETDYRVWAYVDIRNVASQRVLEKVGMVKEGTLHRWAPHPGVLTEPSDASMYAKWR